jgi:UDP-3-O-[3-hydroxymyristoyl] glucosamine N-acyltransferase
MKLRDLADIVDGRVVGDPETDITGVSGFKEAKEGDITFYAGGKDLQYILNTKASAVIAKNKIKNLSKSMIVVDNPHLAFARALEAFYKKPLKPAGISKEAFSGEHVKLGEDVSIYPLTFIGNNVTIGNRTTIFPYVYLGDNVTIGDDSCIYPHVTVMEKVRIGQNVIIHSGTVVGSDGFGYVKEGEKHHKILQVGSVVIGNDVEIGAGVTIDRATTGDTVIGNGTKIDNLVQIAHNVKIGSNCIIIAQTAIGGSAEISDGVIIAGQVGVRDHVRIGKGAMVGAQSGIGHDIPDGQIFSGSPAIPHKTWLRAQGIYSKLPEYIKRLQALEKKTGKEDR